MNDKYAKMRQDKLAHAVDEYHEGMGRLASPNNHFKSEPERSKTIAYSSTQMGSDGGKQHRTS